MNLWETSCLVGASIILALALPDQSLNNNNNNNTLSPTLSEILNSTTLGNISEYVTLLDEQHRDLFDLLSSPPVISPSTGSSGAGGTITILIPNNDAFDKIPYSGLGLAFKNNDSDTIRSTLEYHVLSGSYPTASLRNTNGSSSFLPTWLGNQTATNVTGGQVVGAVQQSPGVDIFTSGLGSRSSLVKGDVRYRGGNIVHVIDTFLTPPPVGLLSTAAQFNLTAFAGALVKTDLLGLVDGLSDVTIFAPTDAALASVGRAVEEMEMGVLEDLLRYHVVIPDTTAGAGAGTGAPGPSASVSSSSSISRGIPTYSPHLTNNTQLPTILSTLNGPNAHLTITMASNSLFVNSARITQLDILLANGVLHIIDNVLSPNDSAARPVPSLATQLPVVSINSGGKDLHTDGVPFTTDFPASATAVATKGLSMTAAGVTESFGIDDVGKSVKGSSTGGGGSAGAAATSMTMTMTSASASASAGVDGKGGSPRGAEARGWVRLVLSTLAMEVVMVMGWGVL